MSTRAKIIFAFSLLLVACNSPNEIWLADAHRPITVVALSDNGSVILRDAIGQHLCISTGYATSDAIKDSYNVGDTLK